MAENKMPAPSADYNVEFIRADLVEPLVEALRSAQRIIERDFPNGQLAMDIRASLQAYEAGQ